MKPTRAFKGADYKMTEKVMTSLALFEEKLALFTAYDSTLDAAFLDAWKAVEEKIIKNRDDSSEVIQGEILLSEADTALENCQLKYIDVKYFAGKAFPDNKEALKEFGEGQYSNVRKSPLRMVQFMEALYGVATKYKTELIAQDFTQAAIDEIDTLTTALRHENKKQQLKKKERPSLTRSRIQLLNAYYGFAQRVAKAARRVFRHSLANRNQFLLAQRHHPKVAKAWIVLPASSVRKIDTIKLLKKFNVTLTNQGKETIDYWRANSINETPAEKQQLEAGEVISIEAEQPVKKFLIVHNTAAKPVRLMMTREKIEKKEEE